MIRIATWNIEHFNDFFNPDNTLKATTEANSKFNAISSILNDHVHPDVIGIVEAPNTTTTSARGQDLTAFDAGEPVRVR